MADNSRRGTMLARLLSMLLGLAGLAFVVNRAWQQRDLVRDALLESPRPGLVVAALAVGLVGMAVIGVWWGRLLVAPVAPPRADDDGDGRPPSTLPPSTLPSSTTSATTAHARLTLRRTLGAFFLGQLGKYVPGGVWHVMGMGEAARHHGVPRDRSYVATLLSSGTANIAAAVVAVAMLPITSITVTTWPMVLAVVVLPAAVVGLAPPVLHRVVGLVERVSRQAAPLPTTRTIVTAVVGQVPVWLLLGTATWLLGVTLDVTASWPDVVVATAVSWLVGFLALPVPGGVGVREAVFVIMLPGHPLAAATAVAARLAFVIVDAVGALLLAPLALRGTPSTSTIPDRDRTPAP